MKTLLLALLLPSLVLAAETTTLPKHTFLLDVSWLHSSVEKQWGNDRSAKPLIEDIPRYEPGGGLQGILSVRPKATYDFTLLQLLYGVTDWLTAGIYLPIVVQTSVEANFGWKPGDYQGGLGRAYSEDDFWAWAGSLGQPRPPSKWVGNNPALGDMVLAARAVVPESVAFLKTIGLRVGGTLQVALPTGRPPDPEELVVAGTTTWDLHSYGDLEAHLGFDRAFLPDTAGVPRLNLGADVFYSWFRPRTYPTPKGTKNPLLQNFAPYVGDTYTLDPGDWFGVTASFDVVALYGPVTSGFLAGGDKVKAETLPALLSFFLGYTYIATGQSRWISQSALWSYDREKFWLPGDKNIFRATANVSLLRFGLPLQIYGGYRAQDLLAGRNTRPSNVITVGLRALLKFW